mmetsp:Transcript_2646/g.6372  ORF Transcript_2646/g.6372 Transcript_2646/m.6372 type:complete len:104 (-) Transcript_2646:538-849(-)
MWLPQMWRVNSETMQKSSPATLHVFSQATTELTSTVSKWQQYFGAMLDTTPTWATLKVCVSLQQLPARPEDEMRQGTDFEITCQILGSFGFQGSRCCGRACLC